MEKQSTASKLYQRLTGGAVLLTASGLALADGPDFSSTGTGLLTMLAAAGAAGLLLMNASLAWDVGMGLYKKYLKKGAK